MEYDVYKTKETSAGSRDTWLVTVHAEILLPITGEPKKKSKQYHRLSVRGVFLRLWVKHCGVYISWSEPNVGQSSHPAMRRTDLSFGGGSFDIEQWTLFKNCSVVGITGRSTQGMRGVWGPTLPRRTPRRRHRNRRSKRRTKRRTLILSEVGVCGAKMNNFIVKSDFLFVATLGGKHRQWHLSFSNQQRLFYTKSALIYLEKL